LILVALIGVLTASGTFADPNPKRPTIGEIWFGGATNAKPYQAAFRQGLRGLGYREDNNVTIVARYANGDPAQLPSLVKEMVVLNVDVMLVSHAVVPIALRATQTIPIICATMAEPVREGVVKSLARPGGNLTGLSTQGPETDAKRLELAIELVPNLKRVGLLIDSSMRDHEFGAHDFRRLADGVKAKIQVFEARTLEEIEAALSAIDRVRPQALFVFASPLFNVHRERIFGFLSARVPTVSEGIEFAEAGALITYSPNWKDMFNRSAAYVDKVLKGAWPSNLPVEQPTKFDLAVNLKTAETLNIKVPESILVRADQIIR
jgi:putative ABC transport system substrate-binding protein